MLLKDDEVIKKYDYLKNKDVDLNTITCNSHKKVWWKCEKGHSWLARVDHVVNGSGCSICANFCVLEGFNDLKSQYPDIAKEWDYLKNEILPNEVVYSSAKRVWWKCNKCNNSWETQISQRTRSNSGCPYCSGRLPIAGENDLATINPKLASEWNYEKNGELTPNDVTSNSGKVVWWKCPVCNFEWKKKISERNRGVRCPVCSDKIIIKGYNDISTSSPQLAKEWDFEKNSSLDIFSISNHSDLIVWWKCERGHSWKSSPRDRNYGRGCPICSHSKVSLGENDLVTVNPKLASEWNYEKNADLKPNDIFPNHAKKVWWKCSTCGHEWKASPHSRNRGIGCPKCNRRTHTSFPEQVLYYYLKKQYSDVINSYKDIFDGTMELDLYIPSMKVGIEYDGENWHKSKSSNEREKRKYDICKKHGILLLRVKENKDDNIIYSDDVIYGKHNEYTTERFNIIFDFFGKYLKIDKINVDIEKDRNKIKKQYFGIIKNNSLLKKYPMLSKEWNYEKNSGITPNMVYSQSNDMYWWKCKKGHEWEASVDNRIKGNGCPYCSGRFAIIGENDLATTNPKLASEWNYEKNSGLTPRDVKPNSNRKAWWKCKKGHEWEAVISSRNRGTGCPICYGKVLLVGFNDLKTRNPKLASEWNYEKNGDINPTNIYFSSTRKVWWKCKKGHEWEATIQNRSNGTGCPICNRNGWTKLYNNEKAEE